jgi:hypothetical protein
MKKHLFFSKMLMLLTFTGFLSAFMSNLSAQTITTTLTNNNGSSVAVFSFQNNNPDPVILTDIGSIAGVTNTYTCHLYVKPATYNVAPGAVGAITAVNGWTLVASNNNLPLTGNQTTAAAQSFITGMSYVVPGNSQVRFALQLATGTNLPAFTATTGSLRYSTLGLQQGVWSAGGCDVNVTTNYGYGGTMAAATFTPRGFIGFVTFIPSVPCSGTPNAGTASISSSVGCPNASFNLSASGISFGSGLTYQWQSSPDGNAPWTDVIGGNSSSFATSTPTNLFYRLRSFCSNSNQENFSNTVSYTVSGGQCACGPYPAIFASNAADEEITNVTIGTMNNSSACGILAPGAGSIINRYGNFTGSVSGPSEMQGATVSFSLTQTSCGGSFGNGFQVYVDWNQDGDFLDADEQVYNQPVAATGNHTKTGTFTVPISALTGTTRMRVVNAEVTFPTATNYAQTAYTWGETEDYCFTVSAAVDCAGTPNPGSTLSTLPNPCSTESFTLSVQNLTSGSGVSYQWQTSPDGTAWTNAGAAPNSPSWTLTHAAATWYRCVVTCGPSAQSTESNGLLVGTSICFCTPVYTSGKTLGDLISNVEITGTTLANNSGTAQVNPAYTYFTGQPNYTGDLQAGTSYSVNVSVGTWGNQHIRAWIDYNDNGIFEPSESIGSTIVAPNLGNVGPFPPASFNISLACNPPSGVHRMRIRSVWQGTANPAFAAAIDPCISYGFGETEDYDVNVLPPPPCPSITNLAVSGITAFTANLSWSIGCAETAWDIHVSTDPNPPVGAPDVVGWNSTSYTASGLTPETQYYAHVRANCGGGNGESAYITIPFTTLPVPPACASNVVLTPTPGCDNYDITLSYDAVPSASGYNIFAGTAPGVYDIANPFNAGTNTTILFQNPALNTTYYFVVQPFNIAGGAVGCAETSITTGSNGCACIPLYTSGKTAGDLISNVEILGTTLSNNSGTAPVNPAFTYFTGQTNYTADLQAGTSYTVSVSVGTWGNQHVRAWIDYNDDDVFDNSESIGSAVIAPNEGNTGPFPPASFNISLACNPPVGVHRMRIRSVWQGTASPAFAASIDPCASYGFGETEDYDVNVLPPPPCPTPSGLVASNITFNSADLNWITGCTETAWQIAINTSPTPPGSGSALASTNFSASNLLPSTTYYAHVRANCGGGNGFSSWLTISFTTPVAPPVNDQICDALDVTSSGATSLNTYEFLADMSCNNQTGNNATANPSPVGASCAGSNGRSMWYTFTTPACGVGGIVPFAIEVTTNNTGTSFDTKLALFESSDNTCSGILTEIVCNDDNAGAGNPAICGTASGLTSTLVQTNLLPNKQYWVYVDGFNAATGDFVLSGRAVAAPHGVSATGGGTQIQLTTANMGAGLYTYYYKQVGSTGYSTFNSASALTDTRTLAPGNSYQTQIMYRCGTNSDQSQWYRTAPQTIALSSTCAIVNNMTCTFNGPNSYTLSWPQPSGVLFTNNGTLTGYRIKRTPVGSSSVFTFSNPDVVCANGTCSVTLPGNSPTGFNWTIETRCSANTVQVGNTTSCAPAPQFEVNNDANNNIARTFENVYSFVNVESGVEFVDVQMFDAYGDFGLNTPMIGDYEMYVNSKNEITWRRVDASVDMSFDFIIVPNPSNAMTTVHLNTVVETGTFTILDAMGRTINSGSINNTDNVNIDAAQLQSGVYMVVVTVGNQQLTRRLVVAD